MSSPVGPYSPWRSAGGWIAVSGQVGVRDGRLVAGGFEGQLQAAIDNLEGVLADAGASLSDVVATTLYLRHLSDFAVANSIWVQRFADPRPTRAAVAVSELALGALVEVQAWAHVGG